ncbi:MAG: permease [Candidatus Riflebacteria bacterium]|nr:permease [Candidatus Riflebacteria bacterium]
METLIKTVQYFLFITAELTVLFLGISTLVALLLMYVSQERLRGWLGRPGLSGNFLGAVFGSLTPFCACSTIPMTLGMLNAGAPFGAVMSFVISSPLLNPVILSMFATLIGLRAAAVYFGVTFLGSALFGFFLEKGGGARFVKNVRVKPGCCGETREEVPTGFTPRLRVAFRTAWSDFKAVLVYLLIGVGVGAGIYGYVPQDFVAGIAGPGNPFAIPIAAIVGIPLYIRAETAIPIGIALSQKGMSIGAVIALIIGGAGMAIPEMAMLASIFRKRLVAAIVFVIWTTAVIGGYVFNAIA